MVDLEDLARLEMNHIKLSARFAPLMLGEDLLLVRSSIQMMVRASDDLLGLLEEVDVPELDAAKAILAACPETDYAADIVTPDQFDPDDRASCFGVINYHVQAARDAYHAGDDRKIVDHVEAAHRIIQSNDTTLTMAGQGLLEHGLNALVASLETHACLTGHFDRAYRMSMIRYERAGSSILLKKDAAFSVGIYGALAGKGAEAVEALEEFSSWADFHPYSSCNLALAYMVTGDIHRGMPHLSRALERCPNNAFAFLVAGRALYAMGEVDHAKTAVRHSKALTESGEGEGIETVQLVMKYGSCAFPQWVFDRYEAA